MPQKHLSVALLTFNVGVELGQLLVVGLAFAVYRALVRWPTFVTGAHAGALCDRHGRRVLVDRPDRRHSRRLVGRKSRLLPDVSSKGPWPLSTNRLVERDPRPQHQLKDQQ